MAQHRKTRIVCVSDTHGYAPAEAGFALPRGDVLIHAGDLSNRGTKPELERTFKWIEEADYEVKIVIAGNHDVSLDPAFYAEHGSEFHSDKEHATSIDLVNKSKGGIIFLNHESALIRLTRPDGPRTMFKVFGSPFSRFSGLWAFGYSASSAEDGRRLWCQIPSDTDILVTHTPPLGLCDRRSLSDHINIDDDSGIETVDQKHGCEQLLHAMASVRPMLAVCGHVHEGRGYQRVMWTEKDNNVGPAIVDEDTTPLPSSDSKKQSLIDLTGKKQRLLQNTSRCATALVRETHKEHSSSSGTLNRDDDEDDDENARKPLRKETCIVNAAIMAKSWPYVGGKAFNRPIIVDINLPVWNHP
ncbi:hypothetical protein UA08_04136 [Talaromyces atroroseus]|uniref:Calcineurin-like phosphoesterase domain-containing protein n=1 Tax=Talaromyces atroroseus TaxID=1441469 RepID=A0A1Q5Q847_TALAT|nr:hypothetical protein UA08_04136 [Talaromyces atroroseus]OKL60308.1 hypothetical protein UA08_04136 [Talaromyces atroroseus]